MDQAKAMGSLNLTSLGYEYVNVDDCWMTETRDSEGNLQADPTTFPNGMKALGDSIHGENLKFGIYSSAGTKTCAGRAGSLYYEEADATSFAGWGVDYLKLDNCFNKGVPAKERYTNMSNALSMQDHEIYFSLCNWGNENVTMWGPEISNSFRTTQDIARSANVWQSLKGNFLTNL